MSQNVFRSACAYLDPALMPLEPTPLELAHEWLDSAVSADLLDHFLDHTVTEANAHHLFD